MADRSIDQPTDRHEGSYISQTPKVPQQSTTTLISTDPVYVQNVLITLYTHTLCLMCLDIVVLSIESVRESIQDLGC